MKKLLKVFLVFTLVFVLSFNSVKAQEQQGDPQEVVVLVETAPVVKIKGNNNSLVLSWDGVTNAQSYVIERSTNSTKGFKKIATITSTTYTDKKLAYGTKYYYKVTAKGPNNSKKSDVVGKKVVPNKVTNVTLKPGSNNVKVYWNQTKNSGYYVYQSTDGKKWNKVKTITDKTVGYFNNKKLKSNKIYYYQVQAYQKVGSKIVTGSKSDVVSIRTAPAVPTAKFVSTGLDSIYINLKPTKGAKYYQLYQYSNETKKYELEYKIEPDWFYNGECDLYFYVEKPYTTLKFKVRACSDTACGSFKELSGQATLRKTDIYSLRGGKTTATLMFESVSGAQGYEIYRSTSKNGKYTKVTTLKGQENTTFKNSKLKSGRTYYYKVRSYVKISGKVRYSPYSSIRSVKVGSGAGVNSAMEDAKKLNKEWYYSKQGLISILTEYFGYSASDAKKGVEKCKIDFKANALKLAKEFIDYYYGISEDGLRKVLSEYYYTQKEIDYALSKVNINWHELLVSQIQEDIPYGYSEQQYLNSYADEEYGYTVAEVLAVLEELNVDYNIQALNRLNTYLDRGYNISETDARTYLEECLFTTDQINYAISNVEYDWLAALEEIAQDYFDYNEHSYGYSKQLLIEYIASYIETNNYETYSSDEIGQVIDRFEFDFKERAYDLADYMADNWYSSRAYIIDYLTNEYKFTEEEVNYAITEVDKKYDFNEVAVNWVGDLALNVHANDLGLNEASIREYLADALFTQDNIDYAIANCGINYNDEALITAKYYIEKANVSKQLLIDALMEYGFTESQATYAANNEEFDYNQECADLLNELTHSLTPTQLRDFLKSEYKFTDENIDYAFEVHNIVEE